MYQTRTEALQHKIKELEAQIQGLEDQNLDLSSRQRADGNPLRPSPGLSYGSSCSPVSQVPITPPVATDSTEGAISHSIHDLPSVSSFAIGVTAKSLGVFAERRVQCCFELDLETVLRGLEPGSAHLLYLHYTTRCSLLSPAGGSCPHQPGNSVRNGTRLASAAFAYQHELAEAINVWWKCCGVDMAGSALNGLPASISPEEITTVWPHLLSEFELSQTISDDHYSVASLFDPEFTHVATDVSQDNVRCLLSKACILMISSAKLETERLSGFYDPDEWWMRFERVDRAVNRFMETMPPVYVGRNNEELSYLVIVHSGIYCAQIQLHSALAECEIRQAAQDGQLNDFLGGVSYMRCTEACRAAALAAALVLHMDMSNMLLFIGIAWVSVSDKLIKDIPRLRRAGKITQGREKEHQLAIIEKCMQRSAAAYPVFGLQLKQIRLLKEQQIFESHQALPRVG
ncbi:GAL4-like Zn(II)2Cys6 (or C6 zinc) binuclear cluster DNA-binding domain [Rhizoctonia solani]|uniref:GAL4-like Zn(II)2Cys6 (Or C6 zinc) binuclear cluster DNA-binding domain n=1 Tax=Rhizoctonia solani TaxID=456999 RepID=A0A8H7IDS1_9AGAM|nr:GAL4-like Zn(II)2Cys6 (or C6 zinc) binuclear cluster DNA-binding domain [Rhizoctonia solani]